MAKNSVFSGIPDQFPPLKKVHGKKSGTIGIYKIDSPSGKVYIGQSWNVEGRIHGYKVTNRWSKTSRVLERSFNKYGANNHKFEIIHVLLENAEQKDLDFHEQFYMDFYREKGFKLLNLKEAGSYGKHSEETKDLIRKAFLGKPLSESHKLNMRKPKSDEARKNMSLGRKQFMRPILQYSKTGDFIEEFECIARAQEKTNIKTIKDCCVGYQKTSGGFVWKYKYETDKRIYKDNKIK